ncbi:myeloid leukemia factor 2-like [Mobula hypostoma]|uniref:myeloid leukemia factor 2-like n=1 Tax=Mobula hypostoma TaxID=723540 RepID=UPI002FC3214D
MQAGAGPRVGLGTTAQARLGRRQSISLAPVRLSPQIRETRRSVRDSESGMEKVAIGHHIGDRAHIMERSRNRRTGDQEQRQDFINLEEAEAEAFDEEWRRETSRFGGARGIGYRRGPPSEAPRPALTYTEPSGPAHHTPRYDW